MIFILVFPILLFFAYNAWNQVVLLRQRDAKEWYFSWRAFFTQDSVLFFVTLALFVLALNLVLIRKTQTFAQLIQSTTKVIQGVSTAKEAP
jgi:hypothetical protein